MLGVVSSKWDMPEAVLPSADQSVSPWIDTARSGDGFLAVPPPWGQIPLGGRRPVSNSGALCRGTCVDVDMVPRPLCLLLG